MPDFELLQRSLGTVWLDGAARRLLAFTRLLAFIGTPGRSSRKAARLAPTLGALAIEPGSTVRTDRR